MSAKFAQATMMNTQTGNCVKTIKCALLTAASSVMLATALATPAQAIPFRDDVGDEGAQEFAAGWNGVVQIFMWNRVTGGISFNCSGSMINPRTVLSAAHCFDNFPEEVYADGPGSLTPIIAFGPDTFVPLFNWIDNDIQFTDDLNGLTFGVDLMMHPDSPVNGVTDFPAADIAMIALSNPLYTLPTYGMLFSPIPEDVFNEGVHVNQIGYGSFFPGSDNSQSSINGRRRAAENMLGLMASQNDFFQALARNGDAGFDAPGNNQLLYWTDFDLPGRTGTCSRTDLGGGDEDSIVCDDNTPGDGVRLDGDTVLMPGPSIDLFPGDALPNEGATAGGDSGGPLMAMNLFNNPLLLGVLSGGFVDGFFHSSGQSYGEVSYYNPLFTYHQWLSENNPYKYVSAMAGDGLWSDADHWIQGLDPNYFVYNEDGEIVNGLPTGNEGGLGQRRPTAGVVFDTPVGEFDAGDDGAEIPVSDGTVSGLPQTLTGPGYTGFVPDNFYGTPNATAFEDPAQFFDVTLAAAGTTTFDLDNAEIDRLTLAGGEARLVTNEDTFLASLIGVNLLAGSLEVNGTLFSREITVWSGVLSGSGDINLFDPNRFLGNGEVLGGALFNVGGVVNPGQLGATGELTLAGDYIQSSGGVLGIDWSATGADLLNVQGGVSLDGLIGVNAIDGYVPTFGDTRRIVNFTGERVGAFAGDTLPGVLFLSPTYGVDYISVTVDAASFSSETSFQTQGQAGLGGYLDAMRSTSYADLQSIYSGLDLLSDEALAGALESLTAQEAFQTRRSNEAHLDTFLTQMRDVVLSEKQATGSVAGGAAFTAGLMGGELRASNQDASLALLAEDGASGPAINEMDRGIRIYASGGQLDGNVRTSSVTESDLEGMFGFVGADIQTRDWLRLGLSLGYASSDVEGAQGLGGFTTSETDTLQVSGYAVMERDALIAMARIAASSHSTDTDRVSSNGLTTLQATGSLDADTLEATALFGYRYEDVLDRFYLTPVASLTWRETDYGQSTQSGSAAAVTFQDSLDNELVFRAGAHLSTTFELESAKIEPRVYAGFGSNLRDADEVVYGSYSNAPGLFALQSDITADENWAEISAGVMMHLNNGLSLAVSYELIDDREEVLDVEALSIGARFRF